jgi:hypothetical protein
MILRRLVAAVLVAAGASSAAAQTAPPAREPPTLTVTGSGEVAAVPDVATLSLGVVTQARTAREALTANSRAMAEAVRALREAGIAERDLRTATLRVEPQTVREQGRPPRITGYQASNRLDVRVRDIARLGPILDRAVDLGANSLAGPSFELSDPSAARDAARRAAVVDAVARARLYAEALGVRLGRILSVTDDAAPAVAPRTAAFRAAAPAPPVEAGALTISASVTVSWAIEQ